MARDWGFLSASVTANPPTLCWCHFPVFYKVLSLPSLTRPHHKPVRWGSNRLTPILESRKPGPRGSEPRPEIKRGLSLFFPLPGEGPSRHTSVFPAQDRHHKLITELLPPSSERTQNPSPGGPSSSSTNSSAWTPR